MNENYQYNSIEDIGVEILVPKFLLVMERMTKQCWVNCWDTLYRDVAGALQQLRTTVYTSAAGDRADVLNWAIIIVDGQSANTTATAVEAQLTRRYGVRLSVVGVGADRVNVDELNAIATTPSTDVYVFNYSQLVDGFAQEFICINLALKGSFMFIYSAKSFDQAA